MLFNHNLLEKIILLQSIYHNVKHDVFRASAIHASCISGNPDVVEYLLRRGADVNEKALLGLTPLLFTMMDDEHNINDLLDVLEVLVKHRAETNTTLENGSDI